MFATSELELFELVVRILADTAPREMADAILMYGQTESNEISTLGRASEIWRAGLAERIVFGRGGKLVKGDPWEPGYDSKLARLGVHSGAIIPVQITAELAHTQTEANSLVQFAQKEGWQRVYVVSSPFHQLRAFVGTVTAILRQGARLKAFSMPGLALPWTEEAVHSQNVVTGKRFKLLKGELDRMNAYYEHGDLVTAREALDYLDQRDQ